MNRMFRVTILLLRRVVKLYRLLGVPKVNVAGLVGRRARLLKLRGVVIPTVCGLTRCRLIVNCRYVWIRANIVLVLVWQLRPV